MQEKRSSRARAFEHLAKSDQDAVIEFLHSLQVLPPGTTDRIVDETYHARNWPPPAMTETSPAAPSRERQR